MYGSPFLACSCHAQGMLAPCSSRARLMLEACPPGQKKLVPFAPNGASLPPMTKPKSPLALRLRKAGPPGRSSLYRWLYEQYDAVAERLNGSTPNWVEVAAGAEAAGVLGTNGKPQSPHAMREMWLRVRRVVEREKAEQMERRLARKVSNRAPRRATASHQPPATVHSAATPVRAPEPAHHPPPTRRPPGPAPRALAPAPKSKLRLEDLPSEARAEFEKLDRGLAEFDRKRFG